MLPVDYLNVLMGTAYPVDQTGWAFYLRLFLLSRKAINATIQQPKDINKVKIPINIDIISYAVMGATSFLCIPANRSQGWEAVTPVMSAFHLPF